VPCRSWQLRLTLAFFFDVDVRISFSWQAARVAEAATDVVRLAMRHDGSLSIAATVAGISFAAVRQPPLALPRAGCCRAVCDLEWNVEWLLFCQAREDGRSDAMFLLALGVDPCNVKLLQIVSEHSPGVR